MQQARYFVFEGIEGLGKTTQVKKLAEYLQNKGYRVLVTKEPGTPLSPLTMELRKLMLDAQFDGEMTMLAREWISQSIRSIHVERVIRPALQEYDFIIQDRGILSGLSYGRACGNDRDWLLDMTSRIMQLSGNVTYDRIVLLTGNVETGLSRARSCKQEFQAGDAIEAKGIQFMRNVSDIMIEESRNFNTILINTEERNIDQVFDEIVARVL